MTWHLFRLTYELHSPLHVGYHKVGNVQRTRYYIPARNLWAAVTERLTRSGFRAADASEGDYQQIGNWVQTYCAFSYFFVQEGDKLLYPRYDDDGLRYGGRKAHEELKAHEFEWRYLAAHVTTALDAATTSAESGSLHEVELIAAYDRDGNRTKLGGWVFLRDAGMNVLGAESKWRDWLGELQVGGERRYGFGQLRMVGKLEPVESLNGYATDLSGERPHVRLQSGDAFLAHTLTQEVNARGQIEPLVGRETRDKDGSQKDSTRFGQYLTRAQVCWVPGSIIAQELQMVLDATGVWKLMPEA